MTQADILSVHAGSAKWLARCGPATQPSRHPRCLGATARPAEARSSPSRLRPARQEASPEDAPLSQRPTWQRPSVPANGKIVVSFACWATNRQRPPGFELVRNGVREYARRVPTAKPANRKQAGAGLHCAFAGQIELGRAECVLWR